MTENIRDLAIFEKLTTVSREKSVFELICYLDLELSNEKTIINCILKNVATGELVKDSIAPEYMGYCSVGSYFKGGKKQSFQRPSGVIRDITIDVPERCESHDIGSELSSTEYMSKLNRSDNSNQPDYVQTFWKQQCMVFHDGADKVIIPCAVIAATFYLTSHSMRTQLFAQNIEGLYEKAGWIDQSSKLAFIVLHRNARTEDAKRIARFALSDYARQCWDNVMNKARELSNNRRFSPLVAKIPVVQQNLSMKVRCHEILNSGGGTMKIVHEILKEHTESPFKKLMAGRRRNAPAAQDPIPITKSNASSNGRSTNRPPSNHYTNHRVRQFDLPHNPLWDDVELEEIDLHSLYELAETTIATENSDETVSLSPQSSRGNDPEQKIAKSILEQKEPKPEVVRLELSAFRDMVKGFERTEGVTDIVLSSDLNVPLKGNDNRKYYTLRESYDGSPSQRRHYTFATFNYNGKTVCLVEIDQSGISTRVGTYVLVSTCEFEADKAADDAVYDFVQAVSVESATKDWANKGIHFMTKSHPANQAQELWGGWRSRVLAMVSAVQNTPQ